METAAVRIRMPGGVGGTAAMSRLPTRLSLTIINHTTLGHHSKNIGTAV